MTLSHVSRKWNCALKSPRMLLMLFPCFPRWSRGIAISGETQQLLRRPRRWCGRGRWWWDYKAPYQCSWYHLLRCLYRDLVRWWFWWREIRRALQVRGMYEPIWWDLQMLVFEPGAPSLPIAAWRSEVICRAELCWGNEHWLRKHGSGGRKCGYLSMTGLGTLWPMKRGHLDHVSDNTMGLITTYQQVAADAHSWDSSAL